MDQNQQQGRLIVEWKWLPPDLIQNALNALPAHPDQDLCQFLVRHSYLDPGRAEQVRHAVIQHPSHFATQVPLSGVSQAPSPSLFNSLVPQSEVLDSLKADRGLAQQYYEAVHARDPLFSPHVHCTLKKISVLGKGGMGTVHEVEDTRLGRRAAYKVMMAEHGDTEATFRFLREARLSARLDHPAIPPVYEAGTTREGELYLLMRLIRGRTLRDHIRSYHSGGRKRGVLVKLLECFMKICDAVAYAHSEGVLHRDLKPSNVMVGPFGEVMVLDWGLARDIKDPDSDRMIQAQCALQVDSELFTSQGLTKAGFVLGTPGYMSPEQAEGLDTDTRTDVYGLGAILFEILCNETPVTGKSVMNVIIDTIRGRIRDVRALRPDCPPELAAIVRSALAHKAKDRAASATALADDVGAYLRGEAVSVYSYSMTEKTRRWIANHPLGLVVSTAALLLGAVLVVAALAIRDQELQTDRAQLKSEQEKAKRQVAESEQRIAEQNAAMAVKEQELIEKRAENLERSLQLLSSARVIAGRKGSKDELDRALGEALRIGQRRPTMLRMAGEIYEVAGRFDAAERCYRDVLKTSSENYEALFSLYLLMDKRGMRAKRDQYSQQIIALAQKRNEDIEFSLFLRGLKLQRAGKIKEAIELYNRAEALSTRYAALYINRGSAYRTLKEFQKAKDDFLKAMKITPMQSLIFRSLGHVEKDLENYQNALYYYTCAIALEPKDAQAHFQRAAIFYQQRDVASLSVEADRLLKLSPRSKDAYNWKVYALVELKDYKAAIQWARRGLKIYGGFHKFYYYMGVAYYYSKNYSQSLASFNRAAQLEEGDYLIYMFRGRAYDQLKQDEKAEADFAKALAIKRSLKILRYRIRFLYERGRYKETLADLQHFDSSPDYWPDHRYFRANVYLKMGDQERAKLELQNFLRLQPKSRYQKAARAKLQALKGQ